MCGPLKSRQSAGIVSMKIYALEAGRVDLARLVDPAKVQALFGNDFQLLRDRFDELAA